MMEWKELNLPGVQLAQGNHGQDIQDFQAFQE